MLYSAPGVVHFDFLRGASTLAAVGAHAPSRATMRLVVAIDAVGVRKVYRGLFRKTGGAEALAGLTLAVPEGAAFGLIGLNGAGKTTFIKTILGVVHPTEGSVRVLGGDPADPRVRARIGYLPERLCLPQASSARQFLASVARLKDLPARGDTIERPLHRVGLSADADRKIGGYSKGMRQRLGLAAALLGSPRLLVLDEPTDGVDPLGRADIRTILAEERRGGATLFLNSHLLSETERVCDRIGVLDRGRLVREGALEELCGSETAWRARFAPGFEVAALAPLGFRATNTESVFVVDAADPTALNDKLERARLVGALLVELSRDLRDLEGVLSEALGGGAREPAPRIDAA